MRERASIARERFFSNCGRIRRINYYKGVEADLIHYINPH
jgi:hypothetical protein